MTHGRLSAQLSSSNERLMLRGKPYEDESYCIFSVYISYLRRTDVGYRFAGFLRQR